ncbi:MAG: hypothetical protein Q8P57_03885 [Candidatus Pacearchaeota archaeon]|nr:hypothetical protein [Candidatus Pacearchaeota archaeon]
MSERKNHKSFLFHRKVKNTQIKYVSYIIALIVLILVLGFFIQGEIVSNAPILGTNVPCTYGAITSPVTGNVLLCGTFNVTTPVIINTNGVSVTCAPGSSINYAGNSVSDLFVVSPGVTGVTVSNCNINGAFSNAIHLQQGVTGATISGNTINGARTGIREDYLANANRFSSNSISNTQNAMYLEGSSGVVQSNSLSNNGLGVFLGKPNSASLNPKVPGGICSSGTGVPVVCSYPSSGNSYVLDSNSISNSRYGIITFGLDGTIKNNVISNHHVGIEVNAIHSGSEINPNLQPPGNNQEYFQSGVTVLNNNIQGNTFAGMQFNGRSVFFSQTSPSYLRQTTVSGNTITGNGAQNGNNFEAGLIFGRSDAISPQWFYGWNEYTDINNNQIDLNLNDGILLQRGNWFTDIKENQITNNAMNGISIGTTRGTQGYYFDISGDRFIYKNSILNNGNDGIHVYNQRVDSIILNEINNNGKDGVYAGSDPSGYYSSFVNSVICNDMSYNANDGFNYDAVRGNPAQLYYYGRPFVLQLNYNRIINNGGDGLRYFLDLVTGPYNPLISYMTRNNHVANNGGYGINVDGFYYYGFIVNNVFGNFLGEVFDSGSNSIENMWDEGQYERGYDNLVCKNCGGACNTDYDCGYYQGTCVGGTCLAPPGSGLICNPLTGNVDCYANPGSLPWVYTPYYDYPGPYNPRGNYGVPNIVPLSFAPPLQPSTCAANQDCYTNSCEFYGGSIQNSQCGNGNFVSEQNQFQGYYQPPFDCPTAYYYSPYQGTFPPIIVSYSPGEMEAFEKEFGFIYSDLEERDYGLYLQVREDRWNTYMEKVADGKI